MLALNMYEALEYYKSRKKFSQLLINFQNKSINLLLSTYMIILGCFYMKSCPSNPISAKSGKNNFLFLEIYYFYFIHIPVLHVAFHSSDPGGRISNYLLKPSISIHYS